MKVAVLALCAISCGPLPEPDEPTDGGPEDCASACARLTLLECPGHEGSPGTDEVYGTADDVSCTVACIELVLADPSFDLAQGCIANARSCAEADDCLARSDW